MNNGGEQDVSEYFKAFQSFFENQGFGCIPDSGFSSQNGMNGMGMNPNMGQAPGIYGGNGTGGMMGQNSYQNQQPGYNPNIQPQFQMTPIQMQPIPMNQSQPYEMDSNISS